MNKAEVAELLKPIKRNYPNFDASIEVVEHYHKYLQDFPFELAQYNVDQHIMTEKYAPTVAHIRGQLAEQTQHEQLREEAINMTAQIEEWKLTAVPMPSHVKEALKNLDKKFREAFDDGHVGRNTITE
ncbi:replicative helicase loader/inhibitor [Paenibacillus psychroresistens]|uniref:replicative helicase loader/inhibitor n=1 Tax=Paenibacillus psychroresistens TaxID=1778678 RepID=UPI001391395C|nr:replicative helicase loader/inhibitor [Paenibacillus psychroresistens]